jgi:molybdenum cofactor cytidylyltransferase
MRPKVHILVLAAGASSRMRGLDKLIQPIEGKPILRHVVDVAVATGAPVFVTLPDGNAPRDLALAGSGARVVRVPDATLGMSRSIVRGLAAIEALPTGALDGLMILPADMPGFSTEALRAMVLRFQAEPKLIWRASTIEGLPGHPIIFPRALWPDLARISGDEGGRSVLKRQGDLLRLVTLPGQMAVQDLDTPEDWAAFHGRPKPLL